MYLTEFVPFYATVVITLAGVVLVVVLVIIALKSLSANNCRGCLKLRFLLGL